MPVSSFPPGPTGHFLMGHIPEFRRDPLAFLCDCARECGDITGLRLGPMRAVLLNHPDLFEQVLVTQARSFVKPRTLKHIRPIIGNGLFTNEGESWRRQRHLINPAFHMDRILGYTRTMTAITERMLNQWHDGESYDIHKQMMHLTLAIAAKTLFDYDVSDQADGVVAAQTVIQEHSNRQINTPFPIPESIPTPANRRFQAAARVLDDIIYGMINERRASGLDGGDLLSELLKARSDNGDQMSAKQLRDEVMTMFLAGHDTTANALAWTCYLLSQHPGAEAKLVEEVGTVLGGRGPTFADVPKLRYTDAVITESMRIYPPAWVYGRESIEPVTLGGYSLPRGTVIFISPWVTHRDVRFFDRPEVFDPERWTEGLVSKREQLAYIPWGRGGRVCIGKPFAMTEMVLVMAAIVQRFKLTLAPGQDVRPEVTMTLRIKDKLEMIVNRRSPLAAQAPA